jgi:cobalt-zinc-cadmium efflux system protein
MAHSHSHAHHHHHGHSSHHGPNEAGATTAGLRFAFTLNFGFALLEIVGGFWSGSTAVLANAVHDLGDAMSFAIGYGLEKQAQKSPNSAFTYGYQRFSLLSALIVGVILLTSSVLISFESIPEIMQPGEPKALGMMGLAALGIFMNALAAYRVSHGKTQNEKTLALHLIADLLGWAAVLVGGIFVWFWHLTWLDPILAIGISLYTIVNVFRSLRETSLLFLQQTPAGLDLQKLRSDVLALPEIQGVHDMHCWSLDGRSHVLSMHVIAAPEKSDHARIKEQVRNTAKKFGQFHITVEIEIEGEICIEDCETP